MTNAPTTQAFPSAVRRAMAASGAMATCVPVQLDGAAWESALFIQVAGAHCETDRQIITAADRPLPLGLETDLIENPHAAVILLRPEIHTRPDDPLVCEILLTPGEGGVQFEAIKLLTTQPRLCWFIGDEHHSVIQSQQHPLAFEHHQEFDRLLKDATAHDALIRMTSRYDAKAALSDIVRHYELRENADQAAGLRRADAGTDA